MEATLGANHFSECQTTLLTPTPKQTKGIAAALRYFEVIEGMYGFTIQHC